MAYTIGEALDLKQDAQHQMIELLATFLVNRKMLLILDNFEQIIEAASLVQHLLHSCPKVHFLVTSRILLSITGEVDYPITPLPLPADHSQMPP